MARCRRHGQVAPIDRRIRPNTLWVRRIDDVGRHPPVRALLEEAPCRAVSE
jgi:hypothetical protein